MAAAALVTWPLPRVFTAQAVGHPIGDMPDHLWGTWWFGHEVLAGRLPLITNLSHFPEALRLWYVDPLGALLVLPLHGLGPIVAWNALLLLQVLASLVAGYALGLRVTASRSAGLVAAAAVGASPYVLGLLHSGLSEYLGLALPALYTLALVGALGRHPAGTRTRVWGAALLLAGCGYQALYYLAFGSLLAACMVPGAGWRERLSPALRIVALGALGAAPQIAVSLLALDGAAAVASSSAPGWQLAELPVTDLLTWVRGGAYYFPDTPARGNPGVIHVNYLGWGVLALAVVGALRVAFRPLAMPLALYGLLAVGPRLCAGKRIITVGGSPVLLPLALLYFPGSPFRMIHQPYRMAAFAIPLLAILAAGGAACLPRWARGLAAAIIVAESLWISPAKWPLATTSLEAPAVYERLNEASAGSDSAGSAGAVLDWPPDATTWNRRYTLWQLHHGRPIPYGVNVFLPEELRADPLVARLLNALEDPRKRATNRDVLHRGDIFVEEATGASALAERGLSWVIVHKAALSDVEWMRSWSLLTQVHGAPVLEDRQTAAWSTHKQGRRR